MPLFLMKALIPASETGGISGVVLLNKTGSSWHTKGDAIATKALGWCVILIKK